MTQSSETISLPSSFHFYVTVEKGISFSIISISICSAMWKVKSSFRWSFQHVHKFSLIFIFPSFTLSKGKIKRENRERTFQTYSFSAFLPLYENFWDVCLLRLWVMSGLSRARNFSFALQKQPKGASCEGNLLVVKYSVYVLCISLRLLLEICWLQIRRKCRKSWVKLLWKHIFTMRLQD